MPDGFSLLRLASRRYAAFTHHEDISTIRRTLIVTKGKWLPALGYKVAIAPYFERYDIEFDIEEWDEPLISGIS